MRVSLVGGSNVSDRDADLAWRAGREIGQRGHTLVCRGVGGVAEAACRGASEADGRTIGILPGDDPDAAGSNVDVPIATGLGDVRNAMVVLNGDGLVAIAGDAGTLSEIGYAGSYGRPVAGLGTRNLPGVEGFEVPQAAVSYVERAAEE